MEIYNRILIVQISTLRNYEFVLCVWMSIIIIKLALVQEDAKELR